MFCLAHDLARWSQDHVRRLAEVGRHYGLDLDPEPEGDSSILARVRQKGSELLGRRPEPALLLLADFGHLHRLAAGIPGLGDFGPDGPGPPGP